MDIDIVITMVGLLICHMIVYAFATAKCAPESVGHLVKSEEDRVSSSFKSDQVVPDVIEAAPKSLLMLSYRSGVAADLGNELKLSDAQQAPHLVWTANASRFYTLLAADPDAPSRSQPSRRNIKHWLVVNIPGGNLAQGEIFAEYRPPNPPVGSGFHRYVFLVFEQPDRMSFNEPKFGTNSTASASSPFGPATSRANFDVKNFLKKYHLGTAVAGNFYRSQNAS